MMIKIHGFDAAIVLLLEGNDKDVTDTPAEEMGINSSHIVRVFPMKNRSIDWVQSGIELDILEDVSFNENPGPKTYYAAEPVDSIIHAINSVPRVKMI